MAEHPIHNLMKISMENIKQMVDVDTIVGNPVKTENGETIIPVSKVSFGFAKEVVVNLKRNVKHHLMINPIWRWKWRWSFHYTNCFLSRKSIRCRIKAY